MLRGEAGIGKSALLDYMVDRARGLEVARLDGIESEMELGFSALHQLLIPYLHRLPAVPRPQRDALSSAFGIDDRGPPDRFLVGLAALTLLARAARRTGLLCVIDDAQWLDRESAAVLAFIARRLQADAIAMLFAIREPSEPRISLHGLPDLHVPGLPPGEALDLLSSVVTGDLDDQVGRRIVAETSGNPLALAELGRELTPDQLAGRALLPEPLPVGPRLEARFLRQIRNLPAATQTLLLTAAADATRDPSLLWRAGEDLGFGPEAMEPVEAEDILTFDPLIRFRHPVIRSAVYHGAPIVERKRVHQALAAATDPKRDPDRRAWHRAAAAAGPSESVAADLERAADRARVRGGWAANAAFLARAAALTPDEPSRVRRLVAAARAETVAGAPFKAEALLDDAARWLDDPLQRALAQRVRGAIHSSLDRSGEAAFELLAAAIDLAPLDAHLARATLLDALAAARESGRFAQRGATAIDIARVARSVTLPPGASPSTGDLLLDANAALCLDGLVAAAPLLRRAITALRRAQGDSSELLAWLAIGCWAAGALCDDEALHALASRLERQARDQGAVAALAGALIQSGASEMYAGAFGAARARFVERGAIEAARGGSCALGEFMVLAWRGKAAEARAQAAAIVSDATERRQGWRLTWVDYALCVLELGLGHYQQALASASSEHDENLLVSAVALPDLIEAAVRCGEVAVAEQALIRVAERVAAHDTPLARGLLARSRALLAPGPEADGLYLEAIDCLGRCRGPSHVARAHLLYGEWLRRGKRRRDARQQLRTAFELFDRIGAGAFAERARLELVATGETARRRTDETRTHLTPQEARIAMLAARGATNPEIASQLFISPNTVDYHLRKVYGKLEVTSRRQLDRAALEHV